MAPREHPELMEQRAGPPVIPARTGDRNSEKREEGFYSLGPQGSLKSWRQETLSVSD